MNRDCQDIVELDTAAPLVIRFNHNVVGAGTTNAIEERQCEPDEGGDEELDGRAWQSIYQDGDSAEYVAHKHNYSSDTTKVALLKHISRLRACY
jgi:hypothetical protein